MVPGLSVKVGINGFGRIGKLDGVAVRVPVEDGSLTDLAVLLAREVTAEEVNRAFAAADPASCVFDAGLTQASGRLADLAVLVGQQL
jgi:glyceraldehyde 3-phosphate dehydrogenase (phosphorylating)